MKRRSTIALHGAVYGQNFGDVLISQILARHLREATSAGVFFPFGRKKFRDASHEEIGRIWKLSKTHAAVMGPGGYFGERRHDQKSWNTRFRLYHGNFYRLVKLMRVPLFIHGVGVGPLSDPVSRDLARQIFDYADLVNVRDKESYDYVLGLGTAAEKVGVYPDVALTLTGSDFRQKNSDTDLDFSGSAKPKVVGLHLPLPKNLSPAAVSNCLDQIKALIFLRPDLRFLILKDGPRQKISSEIRDVVLSSGRAEETTYIGPHRLLQDIARCDAVVTTKLHVGICASALGVAPLSLYSHPKVLRFFNEIGRLDFCEDVLSVRKRWLVERFESHHVFLDSPSNLRIDSLRTQASKGLDELGSLIKSSCPQ